MFLLLFSQSCFISCTCFENKRIFKLSDLPRPQSIHHRKHRLPPLQGPITYLCKRLFLKYVLFLSNFGKKCDVLTFLLRIQNTQFCKNSSVDIQVVSWGLIEVWRKTTKLVVSNRSPNVAINDLSNSKKKQEQFNVLNLLYCDRSYQEG